MKSKLWKIKKIPEAFPTVDDFVLTEEEVPSCCKDGDFVTQAEAFIIDPYAAYDKNFLNTMYSTDKPYFGGQLSRVVESKNEKFPVGTLVCGFTGWSEKTHLSKDQVEKEFMMKHHIAPNTGKHPTSTALHVLGISGLTAYYGVKDLEPQPGDVCFVNGTSGGVGSIAGQILKILGCKVIGCAGSEKKVQWVKDLGIDHVFNYKTEKISDALKKYAPNGINIYFDNVGGDFTKEVLPSMVKNGKMSVTGVMETETYKGSMPLLPLDAILWKTLKVLGNDVTENFDDFPKALILMSQWVNQGMLKYEETKVKGFENLPKCYSEQFNSSNRIGFVVVEI